MPTKRKLMIVIQETGKNDGKHFEVYLSGDKERIGTIKVDELSPAEFWGAKLFNICIGVLGKVGVVESMHYEPPTQGDKH